MLAKETSVVFKGKENIVRSRREIDYFHHYLHSEVLFQGPGFFPSCLCGLSSTTVNDHEFVCLPLLMRAQAFSFSKEV